LGNLIKRVSVFVKKYGAGSLSKMPVEDEIGVIGQLKAAEKKFQEYDISSALSIIWNVINNINKYINEQEPWKITDKEKLMQVIYTVLESIRIVISYLEPFIPDTAEKISHQLGFEDKIFSELHFGEGEFKLKDEEVLFPKIELKEKKIFPLDLKVAEIEKAEQHPDADKLLVLQINLGNEKRQLVAGIKSSYSTEELIGKHIVVVTNLKPAKLRGVESKGMLLAGEEKGKIVLVNAEKSKPGDQVLIEGYEIGDKQISIEEFMKIKLESKDKKVLAQGNELKTETESISIEVGDGVKIR
jgi:methionyl-tRNA synthetase